MAVNDVTAAPTLNEKHSLSLRLWHWCSFLVISCSLISVLVAGTLLKAKFNVPVYQQAIEKTGATLSVDQAKALNKAISRKLWTWHKYFGYVLAGLLLFRFGLEFFQPGDEKFFGRIKNVLQYLKLPGADGKTARHYLIVKLLYTFFYVSLTIMVLTGLTIAFDTELGVKPYEETFRHIHSFFMYVILSFIAIHLGGVVLGELTRFKGVVSGMINGGGE
jgi:Ni/Fe-hydrogenase 1 B-type cytochrome subunit